MLGYWKPQTSPRRAPLRPEWIHSLATDSLVHEAGRWRLRGIPRNDFGFKNDPKCHRRPCSLPLADLRPDRFPSGPLLQTASDLNIRTARASSGDRTFYYVDSWLRWVAIWVQPQDRWMLQHTWIE